MVSWCMQCNMLCVPQGIWHIGKSWKLSLLHVYQLWNSTFFTKKKKKIIFNYFVDIIEEILDVCRP